MSAGIAGIAGIAGNRVIIAPNGPRRCPPHSASAQVVASGLEELCAPREPRGRGLLSLPGPTRNACPG